MKQTCILLLSKITLQKNTYKNIYKKSFKRIKRLKKNIMYIIYIMSEDLTGFFSTDFNNWNYNEMINNPGVDPYNNQKIRPFRL